MATPNLSNTIPPQKSTLDLDGKHAIDLVCETYIPKNPLEERSRYIICLGFPRSKRNRFKRAFENDVLYFTRQSWDAARIKPYLEHHPNYKIVIFPDATELEPLKEAYAERLLRIPKLKPQDSPEPVAQKQPEPPIVKAVVEKPKPEAIKMDVKTEKVDQADKKVEKPKPAPSPVEKSPPAAKEKQKSPKEATPEWSLDAAVYQAEPLPPVFNTHLTLNTQRGKAFLYLPWIEHHGDRLMNMLATDALNVQPFNLVEGMHDTEIRRIAKNYCKKNTRQVKKLVKKLLLENYDDIEAFLFSMDWPPMMKLVVDVCRELKIPTILIPHESVFFDAEMYYTCVTTKNTIPATDFVLPWGGLQESIFVERGYPKARISQVGSPKLDQYINFTPKHSYERFCYAYDFNPAQRTMLFACQPMDSQFESEITAIKAQRQAILDAHTIAQEKGLNFLLRMPPSQAKILTDKIKQFLLQATDTTIDEGVYLLSPEECVYHCDYTVSVNSTMLFESWLVGNTPISTKYIEFEQIWANCNIPAVHSLEEFKELLEHRTHPIFTEDRRNNAWANENFSPGQFDGKAIERITTFLKNLPQTVAQQGLRNTAIDRIMYDDGDIVDQVVFPSNPNNPTIISTQCYLNAMLNSRQRLIGNIQKKSEFDAILSADVFGQWGITESQTKRRQRQASLYLGKKTLIVEDAFIRSVDIGLSGTPALGILLDDTTAYYNAHAESMMQRILNSDWEMTEEQTAYARHCIQLIQQHRITKYNHAPYFELKVGDPERPKILLLDQRFGDQSIESGMANAESFTHMLNYAMANFSSHDIIVKQHPDAIKGGKGAHYTSEVLEPFVQNGNVHIVDFDVNPHAMFNAVETVMSVTSGMGFEALLAGKEVVTFGAPFYAGRGITKDIQKNIPFRKRPRSMEDIFYVSYIMLSRYYSPTLGRKCQLHELIDHIVTERGWG
jgi:hypothetical protein